MTIISIHQSQYIPWPPYFRKIMLSDIFVLMDSVQFQKNGVQNRNKIRNRQSDFWLTVPVGNQLEETISEKKIINLPKVLKKHWRSIEENYSKAPNWFRYQEELYHLYHQSYENLVELNDTFLVYFLKVLHIKTKIIRLSSLDVQGSKTELLINICKKLEATHYLSGYGATDYMDTNKFDSQGIQIQYIKSIPPTYEQIHGEFISGLSIIDFVMNATNDEVQAYFRSPLI